MSYVNLVAQAVADGEEYFQHLRDFVCKRNGTFDHSATGIGWTLIDESYAVDEDNLTDGDWVVIKSVGESGDEDMYYELMYETTTYMIQVRGFLYWNDTTHAGVLPFNTNPLAMATAAGVDTMYIYGDLDAFIVVHKYGALYQPFYIGKVIDNMYPDTVANCSGVLTAGSDVSITLDAIPSEWQVGQNIFIRDDAHLEKIEIKTLGSLVLTADLVNSYAAGSKLRADFQYLCPAAATSLSPWYGLVGHGGLMAGANIYITGDVAIMAAGTNAVPDTLNSAYLMNDIALHDNNPDAYYGKLKHCFVSNSTGKTLADILISNDGTEYRYFYGGAVYLMLKEV